MAIAEAFLDPSSTQLAYQKAEGVRACYTNQQNEWTREKVGGAGMWD